MVDSNVNGCGGILTQARLKEVLSYDISTGIFTCITGSMTGWMNYGYLHYTIDGVNYKAHRLVFLYITGQFPLGNVDHVNHARKDNRYCNLRDVSTLENNKNLSMNRNNKSSVNGVSWSKSRQRWCVYGSKNNKTVALGRYKVLNEAIDARQKFNIDNGFHENHCLKVA